MLMLRPEHRKHLSRRVTKRAPTAHLTLALKPSATPFPTPSRDREVSPAISAAPALSSGPLCASLPSTPPTKCLCPDAMHMPHAMLSCTRIHAIHAMPPMPSHVAHPPRPRQQSQARAIGVRSRPPPDALGNRPPLAWAIDRLAAVCQPSADPVWPPLALRP